MDIADFVDSGSDGDWAAEGEDTEHNEEEPYNASVPPLDDSNDDSSTPMDLDGEDNSGKADDADETVENAETNTDDVTSGTEETVTSRRSGRVRKQRSYKEWQSEDETESSSEETEDGVMKEEEYIPDFNYDKLIGRRPSKTKEGKWEYLVTFKKCSYLHTNWVPEEDIISHGSREKQKIKRYVASLTPEQVNKSTTGEVITVDLNECTDVQLILGVKDNLRICIAPQFLTGWSLDEDGSVYQGIMSNREQELIASKERRKQREVRRKKRDEKKKHFQDFEYIYNAKNNDTPAQISELLGINASVLVKINSRVLPGLQIKSKLMENTKLQLPEKSKQTETAQKLYDEYGKYTPGSYRPNVHNIDPGNNIEDDNDIVSDNSSDDDDLKIETSTEALYLVKWRGLAYEASTWERACDVDDDLKIAQFRRVNRPPLAAREIMQRVRSNARMKQKGKNIFSELIVDPEGLYDIPLMKMLRHAAQTLHIKYKTMAAQSGVTSSQISNYLRQHHMGKKTLKKIQPLLREWHDTYCKPRLEDFEIRGCLDELCEAITWEQGSIDTKVYLEKAKNDIALKKSELEKKQLIFKTQEKDAKFEKFQRLTMRREERLQRKSVYSKKMQIYSEKIAERNKELQERKNMRKEEATQRKNISENNLIVDEKLEKLEQPIDYTFDLRSDSDEEPEPETKKVYYDLQVPPGLKTGDLLSFEAPDGNNRTKKYTIQVPAGVSTGDTLRCAVNVTVPNDVSKSSKDISRLELLRRDLAIFEDVVKVAEDNLQKELNRAAEAISKNPYILKMKQKKAMEESRMKVLERQRLRREQEASTDETNKIKNQSLNDPENNENAMKEENKENSEERDTTNSKLNGTSSPVLEESTNSQTSEMNIDKNLTNETTTATKPPMPQKNPLARAPGTYKSGNALRSYQLAGLKWLANNYSQGRSCILADEMGLGKTIQVVALLEHIQRHVGNRGPFLVVAPLSTLGHWKRTFETWTDMNVCFYYDGNGRGNANRAIIRQWEWYYTGMPFDPSAGVMKFNVLLTSYEILYSDREFLEEIPWQATVIDEGHRLRNMKSKILGAFEEMDSLWSLLLTGTPLQNNLMELWTLLDFVAPRRFGTAEEFEYQYGELTSSEQVQSLQKRMAPYVLRRVKEDVEKSILKRVETIIDVELTMLQKQYYRAIYDRNRSFLYKGVRKSNHPLLNNMHMQLRKCCNHPFLINGVENRQHLEQERGYKEKVLKFEEFLETPVAYQYEIACTDADHVGEWSGKWEACCVTKIHYKNNITTDLASQDDDVSAYDVICKKDRKKIENVPSHLVRKGKNYDSSSVPATSIVPIPPMDQITSLIQSSGKMLLLDKLLPKLKKEGHRVLIFSQMVIMLDILQDYLNLRSIKFERLDGSTHGNKRQASIDRFTAEGSDRFVFLLSTRAGGVGINLTAADTVIIFDSDWNPQNDMQATARCHRIGQKKQVTVYRFLMRNSYESTMFEVASRKLAMEQAVMGRRSGGQGSMQALQASEMDQLLRHGAYAVMGGDNDNKETKSFQNASIDDILSRHSRTVEHEVKTGGSETSAMSNNLFNKVSFKGHDDDGDDVDVDDPDFWSKVLPNMLSADGLLARLNDGSMASEPTATRNLFLEEVEELVSEMVTARNKAQEQTSDDEGATPGPSAHETEVACSLLLQISTMRTSFTERQRETAEGWLAELEGGRLRKRGSVRNGNRKRDRKRKRGYNDNSDDDFNDSDDVFEDRAGLTLARVLADDYLLMSELKRLIEKKDYVTGLRDALLDECDNRDIDVGHNPRSSKVVSTLYSYLKERTSAPSRATRTRRRRRRSGPTPVRTGKRARKSYIDETGVRVCCHGTRHCPGGNGKRHAPECSGATGPRKKKKRTNSRRSTTKRKRVAYPEGEIISTTRTRKTKHYDDGGGDDFDIEEAPEQSSGDTFSRLKKRINAEHVYVANDDESPFMIAKKLLIPVSELLALNKLIYAGLVRHAKLVEGTTLELPPKNDQSHETQKLYDTHAKHIEAFLHTHELEDGEQWSHNDVLDKNATPLQLRQRRILSVIANARDGERERAELFFELPDKELYPDYYKLIKSPIDLIMISKSIDAGKYRSLSAFANDIDLMFSNAKKYNMEGSLILEDVEYMENYFIRKLEMIQIEETKINSQCPEYDALDNETPEEIAAKLSVSLQELLDANINRFPGISATSKLEPGTNLLLPMLLDKVNPPDGVISFKTSAVDDSESDGDEEKWEIYYNWLNRVSKLGKENIVLKLNGVRLTANDVPKI